MREPIKIFISTLFPSKVGKRPIRVVAKLLEDLPWMCRNYEKGCREIKMDVKDLEHHQRKCIFRPVFCPYVFCNEEKVMFKDIIEHYETCHRKMNTQKMVNGETNKWNMRYPAKDVNFDKPSQESWTSTKVTTSCGYDFTVVAYLVDKSFNFWLNFLGSADEAKMFTCLWSFNSKSGNEYSYRGEVHTLDKGKDDITASGSFFAIPINAVKFSSDEKKCFKVEVTIRNLKEEAKDSDTSSGVSDDE